MPAHCGAYPGAIPDKLGAAEKRREMERELSLHGAATVIEILDACGDNGRKRLIFMSQSLDDVFNRGYERGLLDGKKT